MMRLFFGRRLHLHIGHIGAPLAEQYDSFEFHPLGIIRPDTHPTISWQDLPTFAPVYGRGYLVRPLSPCRLMLLGAGAAPWVLVKTFPLYLLTVFMAKLLITR